MQAVVLAAGEGTRMRPLTARRPKPMLPVADQPLVAHVVDAAIDAGIAEVVIVVGYEAAAIREYFGSTYRETPISYAVQEEQAGTADAVAAAREYLAGDFLVLNGDNLYDSAAIATLRDRAPAVCAMEVANPTNYGVLETAGSQESDEGATVTDIVEKPADPPSNLANAGAYAFPESAREWLDVPESERGEREITDVLARVIDAESVSVVTCDQWLDVGRPWELLEANEWKVGALAEVATASETEPALAGDVHEDATVTGPVVVEEGATVREGVTIEGPALVRAGATVGPNAYIRGTTLIGHDTMVGHAVEIKNSVLMNGATVGHLAYVGDSVLGRDVNFGAGTNVANLRHDDESVHVQVKGESVDTGRRKFGVVVGDAAKTGIDTNLNVGVVLGDGEYTTPGETLLDDRR